MTDILNAIDSALSEHDRLKSSIEERHAASSVDAALQPDPDVPRRHPWRDLADRLLGPLDRPWWRPRWWR